MGFLSLSPPRAARGDLDAAPKRRVDTRERRLALPESGHLLSNSDAKRRVDTRERRFA